MKSSLLLVLAAISCFTARAHTGGEVEMTCPLDGTKFKAWQDFSGTSFGARLDLKKEGPIAQPWALAQCPKCRFPLFKGKGEFSAEEISRLRSIVAAERFQAESKDATPYYAFGIIEEELNADPNQIAWVYLCASWEVEDKPLKYRIVARKVIFWCDQAAKALVGVKDKAADYFVACYLPIEISRRIEDFRGANLRIAKYPRITEAAPKWIGEALRLQSQLIAHRDSAAHSIGENANTANEANADSAEESSTLPNAANSR